MQKNQIAEAYLSIIAEATGKIINAEDHPLYQKRDHSSIGLKSDNEVHAALNSDATSVRIMGKGHKFADGEKTGVRLNINVLKNTKVPVLTMHSATNKTGYKNGNGFYNGEAKEYKQTATLHHAYFNVNQRGRENIAAGKQNKFPMASVDGDNYNKKPNFDGVEARFNPRDNHLFVDGHGKAIRSAEEVTLHGHRAYLRGKIEYHTAETAPKRAGDMPTNATLAEEIDSLCAFYADYIMEDTEHPMIDHKGNQVHMNNSEGKAIHPTEAGIKAFHDWAGGTELKDEHGRPQVMYHGTSKDVDYKEMKVPKNGTWLTTDKKGASDYAKDNDSQSLKYEHGKYREVNSASRVMPVYVKSAKTHTLSADENKAINVPNYKKAQGQVFDTLRDKGIDNIDHGHGIHSIIGGSHQIKSALGNSGAFNPTKKNLNEMIGEVYLNMTNN